MSVQTYSSSNNEQTPTKAEHRLQRSNPYEQHARKTAWVIILCLYVSKHIVCSNELDTDQTFLNYFLHNQELEVNII